jgi:hypothetical protein
MKYDEIILIFQVYQFSFECKILREISTTFDRFCHRTVRFCQKMVMPFGLRKEKYDNHV